MASAGRLISVDYEVFGRVQGVFFRKYTQDTAKRLGLVGWVKNTESGTVAGTVQGQESKVRQMKEWLSKTGSPKSKIDRFQFQNETEITSLKYATFDIIKPKKKKKKTF